MFICFSGLIMDTNRIQISDHQVYDSSNLIEDDCVIETKRNGEEGTVLTQPAPKRLMKLSVEPVLFLVVFGTTMSSKI